MSLSFASGLRRWVAAPDIAVDLGTANTRLYANGHGLIADEPSLIKVKADTGAVEAVGAKAARLTRNDPNAYSISPLHSGVVADIDAASSLLEPLFKRARKFGMIKPRALACAPTDACDEERAALVEATQKAGASSVVVVPEPLAAAIGAGLDITLPYAQMLVDIGDGVTDIAVIRSSSLITTSAVRTACSDLHHAVSHMISFKYGVLVPPKEAERLTWMVGALTDFDEDAVFVTYGTDLLAGGQVSIYVSRFDVVNALEPVLNTIVGAITNTVRELPLKTSCEVIENGICLTGGGAKLRGINDRLAEATSLDIHTAKDPMRAVINGARQMLQVGAATGIWNN